MIFTRHFILVIAIGLLISAHPHGQIDARSVNTPELPAVYPLTSDNHSFFSGWSPDSKSALVGRWGEVTGEGAIRQTLGELWAVNIDNGAQVLISRNAVQPSYNPNGEQLTYLSYDNGAWTARLYDLAKRQESNLGPADWRNPPAWVNPSPSILIQGQPRQMIDANKAAIDSLPDGALVRHSPDGSAIAWSNGAGLWLEKAKDSRIQPVALNTRVLSFCWSPNGRLLAYTTAPANATPQLWIVHIDDNENPQLILQGQDEVFSQPSWSPDSRQLAFSRTPLGAGSALSSDIWLSRIDSKTLYPLLVNHLEESDPCWSPDGRLMAFQRDGDVWIMDLTGNMVTDDILPNSDSPGDIEPVVFSRQTDVQLTPPQTIRVIHDDRNTYRDVPAGQIDEIPFEEYVRRVVPLEISPASWPEESIKVQAVASRTYAWYYVLLRAGEEWDVTDWTNDQVMGREDQKHPNSNAAVNETEGQYIAYQGNVIKAFYCAESGTPTAGMNGVDYIQAVDDPVSFGQTRTGHGWGLSQRGAKRWAEQHDWGYQQILTHYFTGVTIELPANGGPAPLGGLVLPWSDHFVNTNHIYLAANASDELDQVSAVRFYVSTGSPSLLATDTSSADGWNKVWDVSELEDTPDKSIDLFITVTDGQNNLQTETRNVEIGLDRRPPTAANPLVAGLDEESLIVTLNLSASDPVPGSGLSSVGFSNQGWHWEGEDLYHQSGQQVADFNALNGAAWQGVAGIHQPGAWYGPYTYDLPEGYAYRAYFRLKTNNVTTKAVVAKLDVVDNAGARLLGIRQLRGTDFQKAGIYQEFSVDWEYKDAGTAGVEFRTTFQGTADLYLDRVLITSYPIDYAESVAWQLLPGEGNRLVTAKFVDRAGNVSQDANILIEVDDNQPPGNWSNWKWQPEATGLTISVQVHDLISGLDVSSARYRYSTDEGQSWIGWSPANCTGVDGSTRVETISITGLPLTLPMEKEILLEIEVSDIKGHTGSILRSLHIRLFHLPLVIKQ